MSQIKWFTLKPKRKFIRGQSAKDRRNMRRWLKKLSDKLESVEFKKQLYGE